MSFNKIIVVGNLGRDPELRYTPKGEAVCSFSLASNERRRAASDAQEPVDIVTWFKVTVWGRQAEPVAKYLTKGRPVYVEGRLRVDEWTDREGKLRHSLEVHATDVQFIDSQREYQSDGRQGETNVSTFQTDRRPAGSAQPAASQKIFQPKTGAQVISSEPPHSVLSDDEIRF